MMKYRILLFIAVCVATIMHAQNNTPDSLVFSHIGPEDGHISDLIVCAERNGSITKGLLDVLVVVDQNLLFSIKELVLVEQRKNPWPRSSGGVGHEEGSFDIRCVSSETDGKDLTWRLSRSQSHDFFLKMAAVTRTAKTGNKLTEEVELRLKIIDDIESVRKKTIK